MTWRWGTARKSESFSGASAQCRRMLIKGSDFSEKVPIKRTSVAKGTSANFPCVFIGNGVKRRGQLTRLIATSSNNLTVLCFRPYHLLLPVCTHSCHHRHQSCSCRYHSCLLGNAIHSGLRRFSFLAF